MSPFPPDFSSLPFATGKALRAAREAAGLTRPDLAALIGFHRQSVAYWERKPSLCPRSPAVQAMAAALEAQFSATLKGGNGS